MKNNRAQNFLNLMAVSEAWGSSFIRFFPQGKSANYISHLASRTEGSLKKLRATLFHANVSLRYTLA